jgi:hypothetical protein
MAASGLRRWAWTLTEYRPYEDVLNAVPRFIDAVYNQKRMHVSIEYLAPMNSRASGRKVCYKKRGINPTQHPPGTLPIDWVRCSFCTFAAAAGSVAADAMPGARPLFPSA